MKFEIKPYIEVENDKYQTLATEIMILSLDELKGTIKTMRTVLCGEIEKSSFSQNVAIVEYDLNEAIIFYNSDIIGREKTIDIYTLLIEFIAMKQKSRSSD